MARGRATRPAPLSFPGWAIRLGETFDAVLAHDAISYMTTEADLLAVFATARAHLRPGGLLIAAPDDHTDTFDPPRVDYQTNRDAETELTYVECSTDLDPNDTTIETTYVFFIKRGSGLRVEVDARQEKMGYKIRSAQLRKIPYMLVTGDREAANGAVAVRHRRDGDRGASQVEDFVAAALDEVQRRRARGDAAHQ